MMGIGRGGERRGQAPAWIPKLRRWFRDSGRGPGGESYWLGGP